MFEVFILGTLNARITLFWLWAKHWYPKLL